MTDRYNGLASPIPDPVPKPEPGGRYRGLASGVPTDPKAETKTEPTSEPKPNRDGKIPADTKPSPDAAEKPDPKPEPDEKPKPSAASKFARAAGIPENMPRQPIKGMSALVKAQWTAGADISEKLAGKLGAKGALKTAARLVPGVGAAYSAIQAYQHAKNGDMVGAVLNLAGAIPGPIGWVGIAAATAWDAFDLGGGKLSQWAEPDGSTTFILPAAAKEIGGVTALDHQLREAQRLVFSFQDGPNGRVWDQNPPEPLRLDGADIEKQAAEWLGGISDLFAEVDKVMSSAGEAYFDEYRERLRPHLEAMEALREQVKPLLQQLTNASDGAGQAYTAVLDANRSAREQLVADGKLSDQAAASSFTSSVAAAGSKVIAADQNISEMFDKEPPPVLTPAVVTGTGTKVDPKTTEKPVTTPAPAVPAPAAATPAMPAKTEAPQKKADDPLADLLRTLNQKSNVPSTPTTPSMPNLGAGGLGGGSPLGNTGGSPLSSSPSKPLTSDGDKKLEEPTKRKLDDRDKDKKEVKKATPLSASGTDNAKTKPDPHTTTERPGAPATVPAQPSTATAAVPAAPAPAPAAKGEPQPAEPSKEVDVKGTRVEFPDAKTAKLASLLAAADPAHPLSLTDAAAQAGLTPPVPGQDPGSQVAPAQAKPGDLLVSGDKKFMLLEPGKFYDLQEYKVVSADQLPQDAGSRGGYFHLNDPSPTGAPGTQPVSGQTAGVDQQVPGGTPPAGAPADASSPKPNDPAPGTPAPAPAGGVPSAGTPGAPKPAPTGGPPSAESTATVAAQPSPSPSTNALDPNAVR
ncbi:hypothetical protein ACP6C7_03790 [Mycolicibacterium septicum]|uniref:ESX-1 secretion-associated protein EspA/EspE-like domain-containing protein n=1 Tax=Mycolicibacterium septicum TaxID=98668 RepID=A0ABW9LQS9_9MYCO